MGEREGERELERERGWGGGGEQYIVTNESNLDFEVWGAS